METLTMTAPKTIYDLRKNLKCIAKQIKIDKIKVKDTQRKNNGSAWKEQYAIHNLQQDFRHKHIAYCLLRGTSYENIERPSSENLPNWDIIEGVKNVYGSY